MIVKYENLVSEPVTAVKEICSFTGIDFLHSMLDIPHSGSSLEHDKHSKGIDQTRIGQWDKHGLNSAEIFICQQFNSGWMKHFNYATKKVSPSFIMQLWYYIILPFKMGLAVLFNLRRWKHYLRMVKK